MLVLNYFNMWGLHTVPMSVLFRESHLHMNSLTLNEYNLWEMAYTIQQ